MGDHPVDHRILAQCPDLIFRFFIDLDLFELFLGDLDGVAFKEDVKDRALLSLDHPLHGPEDAVDDDPVTRGDLPGKVIGDIDIQRLGLFAAAESFR